MLKQLKLRFYKSLLINFDKSNNPLCIIVGSCYWLILRPILKRHLYKMYLNSPFYKDWVTKEESWFSSMAERRAFIEYLMYTIDGKFKFDMLCQLAILHLHLMHKRCERLGICSTVMSFRYNKFGKQTVRYRDRHLFLQVLNNNYPKKFKNTDFYNHPNFKKYFSQGSYWWVDGELNERIRFINMLIEKYKTEPFEPNITKNFSNNTLSWT